MNANKAGRLGPDDTVLVLLDDGALVRNGTVKLTRPLAELKIPPTVQGILAARIDGLPQGSKELLQTLSVIGREFPLSLVRAVVTKSDDELTRILNDLQLGEFIYEQAALGETEFVFKHALTQEVAYNSLLIERRKLLHERAAMALESIFAGQLEDHLDELAHHYSRSNNIEKAVEYLGLAGQQAAQRSAYADAVNRLRAAIDLLQRLPVTPGHLGRELSLQLAVGNALQPTKGFAAPEVERAYIRARELCERMGDPSELFPVLLGLWFTYLVRGELRKAYELGQQLLAGAERAHDPVLLTYALMARGAPSYWMGDFLTAREHFETAISLYDPERHQSLTSRYLGLDPGVYCLSYAAWTLWHLGYPGEAVTRANEAVALAREPYHPFSLEFAESFSGCLRQYRRETRAAQVAAERLITLSTKHWSTAFSAYMTVLRGWAMAEQGCHQEGIEQIQDGLAANRSMGTELLRPNILGWLAEAYRKTSRFDDGLDALTQALAAAEQREERQPEAEIHRLKGELLLGQDQSNTSEAQRCFERAIEIARKQSAKSWELRATTSLARLLAKQGNRDEAGTMLANIYNWFTEGFDTADLKDAKALLDELSR